MFLSDDNSFGGLWVYTYTLFTLQSFNYTCEPGKYLDSGNLVRACLPSGQLTGAMPVCSSSKYSCIKVTSFPIRACFLQFKAVRRCLYALYVDFKASITSFRKSWLILAPSSYHIYHRLSVSSLVAEG